MPLTACPSCASAALSKIYDLQAIPVQSCILLDTQAGAADFPRRELVLMFCADCGLVFNAAFDASLVDYASRAEESQHFSGTFDAFARELVREIAARYELRGKRVLEIGCGKGEYLLELCRQAGCEGLGIDPGFIPERLAGREDNAATFRREYFDPAKIAVPPDLIVCRHVLEHIGPVGSFVGDVRAAAGNRPEVGIFFETPDVRRVLAEGAFWDLYYEHCSYFTAGSHARLFRRAGFEVTELRLAFGGQYIVQHARPAAAGPGTTLALEDDLDELRALAAAFPSRARQVGDRWHGFVRARHAAGRRIAVWGGGSKAVSFLTSLGLGEEVAKVVDINPFKQGKYLPGAGHRISAPQELLGAPPDTVIAMNPVYLPEIGARLAAMGLSPELVAL